MDECKPLPPAPPAAALALTWGRANIARHFMECLVITQGFRMRVDDVEGKMWRARRNMPALISA